MSTPTRTPMSPLVSRRGKRYNNGAAMRMSAASLGALRDLDGFHSIADMYRARHHSTEPHYPRWLVGRSWTSGLSRGAMSRAVV